MKDNDLGLTEKNYGKDTEKIQNNTECRGKAAEQDTDMVGHL